MCFAHLAWEVENRAAPLGYNGLVWVEVEGGQQHIKRG
jgi:hypothetical protein